MTSFTVDLLDGSNNPIGDGPLANVLSVSCEEKLDEAGQISFVVPATDSRAATLIDQAARFRVRLSNGALVYGIIDRDTIDATANQPNRTVTGASLLRELQHYSMGWWCFYDSQDLNTVVLPNLVANTGWSLGTVDASLGTIYYRFDGDSRLAALIKIAQATGKHFRLGSTFRTIDFGAFGAASGVTLINRNVARRQYDGTPILGSLQVTSDRAPIVNRIYPWGAGQDDGNVNRAKVSLFHLAGNDSRWANIRATPGVRGAQTTITSVGQNNDGDPHIYNVASSTGFTATPITQLLWCDDPADLTGGKGYDFVVKTIASSTRILVRGSPTLPALPTSFPATLISDPQLYLQDDTAYAAEPHEAVVIFDDITLTDLSLTSFAAAAAQLYDRAAQYLATHKTAQISYAIDVLNCPETLHVGDQVHVTYSGAVTRGGVTVNWVDIDTDLYVINITRTYNADGSTRATLEVSNVARQASDSAGAIADAHGKVLSHGLTAGSLAISGTYTIEGGVVDPLNPYNVKNYGAFGDGVSDDTVAIQDAIDAAFTTGGTVWFPEGTYCISAAVSAKSKLLGAGNFGSRLKCTAAAACLSITQSVMVENIMVLGNSTATVGLLIDTASATEIMLRDVYVAGCTSYGLQISNGANIIDAFNVTLTGCPTALRIDNGASIHFYGGDFYGSASAGTFVAVDIKVCYLVTFDGVWMEGFDTFFLFDGHTGGGVAANSVQISKCYLLSTRGSSGNTTRAIKATVAQNDESCDINAIRFDRNHLILGYAEIIFDVLFSNSSYSNFIFGSLRDNYLYTGTNTAAWVKTDLSGWDYHLRLYLAGNEPTSFALQDGAGGFIYDETLEDYGVYNVKDYGALGDGVTDDTTSIQAAITAATAASGEVFFPAATYVITDPLSVTAPLRGSDMYDSRIKCTTSDACLSITTGAFIEKLTILGDSTATAGILIDTSSADEVELRDVYVYQCASYGIQISNGASNIFAYNLILVANPTAVRIDSAIDVHFYGGDFYGSTGAGTFIGVDIKIGTLITFEGVRMQAFDTFFNFDGSTGGGVEAHSIEINKCYISSARGSSGNTTRAIKVKITNSDQGCNVKSIRFEKNYLLLNYAAVVFDVLFNGGNYANRIFGTLKDNYIATATNTSAWFKTDMSGNDAHLRLVLENNEPITLAAQSGTGGGPYIGFYNAAPIARPTTSSGTATFTQNSGNAVNDASTFDGYTLNQVVKALRDLGLLT